MNYQNYQILAKKTKMKNFLISILSLLIINVNASTQHDCFKINNYNYENEVEISEKVSDDHYDDALFVGDSRMGAFSLYGTHENRQVYYIESLFLNKIDITTLEDGDTIYDKIINSNVNNIYLMFGLNETGWQDYSLFVEQYDKLIKEIKQLKPDINIYIFLLYTCYKTTALSHEVIKDSIDKDNQLLKQMCIDNKVLYLDLNQVLLDEDGYIKDDLTNDGIHLNAKGSKIMEDYIDTHVYRKEKYVKEACN